MSGPVTPRRTGVPDTSPRGFYPILLAYGTPVLPEDDGINAAGSPTRPGELHVTFLGWVFWVSATVALVAFIASEIMMAIGRFGGRGAVSADGMRQFFWACVGTMAISIVTGIFSL